MARVGILPFLCIRFATWRIRSEQCSAQKRGQLVVSLACQNPQGLCAPHLPSRNFRPFGFSQPFHLASQSCVPSGLADEERFYRKQARLAKLISARMGMANDQNRCAENWFHFWENRKNRHVTHQNSEARPSRGASPPLTFSSASRGKSRSLITLKTGHLNAL
jgi:hypothetical protein